MRCTLARDFNVQKALRWRSAIHQDPPYQRKGSIWDLAKQQRFIDSLLNGYDVPKFYLHDLRGTHPTLVYAIVDGKQRLNAIWGFLRDEYPLAADFIVEARNLPALPGGTVHPRGGQRFSELDPAWREVLKYTDLSVVLIKNASPDDIEELFARLNNGEPLNAPEKRNAIGGDLAGLVREVAGRPLFTDRVRFGNDRYQHFDLAVRLLALELAGTAAGATGLASVPDLRADALDDLVRAHRRLDPDVAAALRERVDTRAGFLESVYSSGDALLAAPASVLVAYLLASGPAGALDPTAVRTRLAAFADARRSELARPETERDSRLVEYGHLLRHALADAASLERAYEIAAGWITRR